MFVPGGTLRGTDRRPAKCGQQCVSLRHANRYDMTNDLANKSRLIHVSHLPLRRTHGDHRPMRLERETAAIAGADSELGMRASRYSPVRP